MKLRIGAVAAVFFNSISPCGLASNSVFARATARWMARTHFYRYGLSWAGFPGNCQHRFLRLAATTRESPSSVQ
jgi:hypothetical protein